MALRKDLIVISLLLLGMATVFGLRSPLIRFFTSTNCVAATSGFPYYNYTEGFRRNISLEATTPFQSYCVVRGAWRVELAWLQQPADFNISIGDTCQTCIKLPRMNTRFGVIQVLAGNDLAQARISFYTERNFAGHETLLSGGEFSFNNTYSFQSFAFTSFSNWTWQVWYNPRYRGNYTCLRPSTTTEVTLNAFTGINVGSIRLGCRNSAQKNFAGVGWVVAIIVAIFVPCISVIQSLRQDDVKMFCYHVMNSV